VTLGKEDLAKDELIRKLKDYNNDLIIELNILNKELEDTKAENKRTTHWEELNAKLVESNKELEKINELQRNKISELKLTHHKKVKMYTERLADASNCMNNFLMTMESFQGAKESEVLESEFEAQKKNLVDLARRIKVFNTHTQSEVILNKRPQSEFIGYGEMKEFSRTKRAIKSSIIPEKGQSNDIEIPKVRIRTMIRSLQGKLMSYLAELNSKLTNKINCLDFIKDMIDLKLLIKTEESALIKENKRLLSENIKLKAQVQEKVLECNSIKAKGKSIMEQVINLKPYMKEISNEIKNVSSTDKSLMSAFMSLRADYMKIKESCMEKDKSIKELKGRLSKYSSHIKALETDILGLINKKNIMFKESLNKNKAQLISLEEKIIKLKQHIEEDKQLEEKLRENYEEQINPIPEKGGSEASIKIKYTNDQQSTASKEFELKELKGKLHQKDKLIIEVTNQIKVLETKLNERQSKYTQLIKENETLIQQLKIRDPTRNISKVREHLYKNLRLLNEHINQALTFHNKKLNSLEDLIVNKLSCQVKKQQDLKLKNAEGLILNFKESIKNILFNYNKVILDRLAKVFTKTKKCIEKTNSTIQELGIMYSNLKANNKMLFEKSKEYISKINMNLTNTTEALNNKIIENNQRVEVIIHYIKNTSITKIKKLQSDKTVAINTLYNIDRKFEGLSKKVNEQLINFNNVYDNLKSNIINYIKKKQIIFSQRPNIMKNIADKKVKEKIEIAISTLENLRSKKDVIGKHARKKLKDSCEDFINKLNTLREELIKIIRYWKSSFENVVNKLEGNEVKIAEDIISILKMEINSNVQDVNIQVQVIDQIIKRLSAQNTSMGCENKVLALLNVEYNDILHNKDMVIEELKVQCRAMAKAFNENHEMLWLSVKERVKKACSSLTRLIKKCKRTSEEEVKISKTSNSNKNISNINKFEDKIARLKKQVEEKDKKLVQKDKELKKRTDEINELTENMLKGCKTIIRYKKHIKLIHKALENKTNGTFFNTLENIKTSIVNMQQLFINNNTEIMNRLKRYKGDDEENKILRDELERVRKSLEDKKEALHQFSNKILKLHDENCRLQELLESNTAIAELKQQLTNEQRKYRELLKTIPNEVTQEQSLLSKKLMKERKVVKNTIKQLVSSMILNMKGMGQEHNKRIQLLDSRMLKVAVLLHTMSTKKKLNRNYLFTLRDNVMQAFDNILNNHIQTFSGLIEPILQRQAKVVERVEKVLYIPVVSKMEDNKFDEELILDPGIENDSGSIEESPIEFKGCDLRLHTKQITSPKKVPLSSKRLKTSLGLNEPK